MFVFNPRWDMHSLRAKEIKDSPNSQAVPKILVLLKKMALSGSTMAQVNLISPILTCIGLLKKWQVSHKTSYSFHSHVSVRTPKV